MKRIAILGLSALALTAGAVQAAPATFEAGTVKCTGGEGVGLIVGSKKSYDCTFKPVQGLPERYVATVTKVGLDVGVTGKTTMIWTVLTASSPLKRRALSGKYYGAAADASVGVGGGANVLVGGSKEVDHIAATERAGADRCQPCRWRRVAVDALRQRSGRSGFPGRPLLGVAREYQSRRSSLIEVLERVFGIDVLDDDGAVEVGAGLAVGEGFARHATRDDHGIGRNFAEHFLAG